MRIQRNEALRLLRDFLLDFYLERLLLRLRCHVLLQRIHDVCAQRILSSLHNVIARVNEEAMLEEQDASGLWHDVYTALHTAVEECSGATLELFLSALRYRVIEVEMQGEIRALGAVGRFVGPIAMR